MNCASCGRLINETPIIEDGYNFCNAICRYDWRKAGKPNPLNAVKQKSIQSILSESDLDFLIEPTGFENRQMRIHLSYWTWAKLYLDGKQQTQSKSSYFGRYREYSVISNFGKNSIIRLQHKPLDIIPIVEIDGAVINIARPLKIMEYLWICIPMVLLFGGGAIGGLLGGMATYSNSLLMRKMKTWIPRYLVTGATSIMALLFYIKFVYMVSPFLPTISEVNSIENQLAAAAVELNKQCPQIVDEQTRLDSVSTGQGKIITYYYSLTRFTKKELDIEGLKKYIYPRALNNIKTNNAMRFMRENQVTMVYNYFDKDHVNTLNFSVTPNDYQ